jgi:hypothetical protein
MSPQSFCQQALAERARQPTATIRCNDQKKFRLSSESKRMLSEWSKRNATLGFHTLSTVHYSTWEISKLEHLPDEFALHTGEFPNLLPFCNAAILSAKAPDQISPHKDQASPIHVAAQSILLARPLKFHRKSSTACVHSRITRRGCHCRRVTGLPVRPQDFRLRRDRIFFLVTPIHIFQLS